MPLMRAKHTELGVVAEVPDNDYYRELGWHPVPDDTPTTVEAEREAEAEAFRAHVSYDPAAHKAEEVVAHIADALEAEAARVIEAEKSGKARKTVLDATD